ncbi:hypothetical protein OAG81_04115 [Flavobacteriaceae bacterium]|nr:hypothetical protein [Flavobacteriaceae bacterium]
MNPATLKEALLGYTASIEDRKKGSDLIKNKPELEAELIALCFSKNQKRENIMASWVLERLILIEKHIYLHKYIDEFLKALQNQKHESKRRPFAKLLYNYCVNEEYRSLLEKKQIDLIVDFCFSTLLEAKKIAPKAFALKTIIFFKYHEEWIKTELSSFIEQELPRTSPGLKATVRQILPI